MNALTNAQRKISHTELPACLANLSPMMISGFLLPACQALALAFVGAAAGAIF
ncbi:hypothetical protein [Pseudomonas sp. GM50]|uniref:hypothetical protein n=1 Tax=Pseudomonas sp. GM50 TaxID=1144332 RepID=UPI0002E41A3E|nr:hypothetical protein [Pseudomonas sp. GM50]